MSKLIRVPYQNLPELNILTKQYQIRYRIKSDDGNRVSSWSPIYSINPEFVYETSGNLAIEKHSEYIAAIWNTVLIQKDQNSVGELEQYDLWIRWGTDACDGTWEYYERVSSTSINLIKPISPVGLDHVSIEIYVPGRPTLRRAMYDVFQSNGAGKVDLINDTITLPDNAFKTGYEIYYESSDPIGGLTSQTDYYARMVTPTTMTLHPTEQDALDNTNKIDLTSHTNAVGFFTWEDCNVCDFLLYSNYNFSPV